jgi:hypothetical protein
MQTIPVAFSIPYGSSALVNGERSGTTALTRVPCKGERIELGGGDEYVTYYVWYVTHTPDADEAALITIRSDKEPQ